MSDDESPQNRITIHVDVPIEATPREAARFEQALAKFAYAWKRGRWDPFISSHAEACEHSDHCQGPGSNVEKRAAKMAWEQAIEALRPDFPDAADRLRRERPTTMKGTSVAL